MTVPNIREIVLSSLQAERQGAPLERVQEIDQVMGRMREGLTYGQALAEMDNQQARREANAAAFVTGKIKS